MGVIRNCLESSCRWDLVNGHWSRLRRTRRLVLLLEALPKLVAERLVWLVRAAATRRCPISLFDHCPSHRFVAQRSLTVDMCWKDDLDRALAGARHIAGRNASTSGKRAAL